MFIIDCKSVTVNNPFIFISALQCNLGTVPVADKGVGCYMKPVCASTPIKRVRQSSSSTEDEDYDANDSTFNLSSADVTQDSPNKR